MRENPFVSYVIIGKNILYVAPSFQFKYLSLINVFKGSLTVKLTKSYNFSKYIFYPILAWIRLLLVSILNMLLIIIQNSTDLKSLWNPSRI